ncbi:UNVERIFIED_CONTAM: hypothetical protein FKN15_005206 [Acipenser sinensis]
MEKIQTRQDWTPKAKPRRRRSRAQPQKQRTKPPRPRLAKRRVGNRRACRSPKPWRRPRTASPSRRRPRTGRRAPRTSPGGWRRDLPLEASSKAWVLKGCRMLGYKQTLCAFLLLRNQSEESGQETPRACRL